MRRSDASSAAKGMPEPLQESESPAASGGGRRPDLLPDRPSTEPAEDSAEDQGAQTEAPAAPPRPWGSDSNGTLSVVMFLLAFAVLATVMARSWIRRRGRRGRSLEAQVGEVRKWADAQLSEGSTPLLGAPADLRRWHVEMEQVARDLRAEIDTKIVLLQATIRSAAEEATRLERAVERARELPDEARPERPA